MSDPCAGFGQSIDGTWRAGRGENARSARDTASRQKAGMVGIDSFALASSEAAFGGVKHSGMGREGGIEGLEGFLDTKLVQTVA